MHYANEGSQIPKVIHYVIPFILHSGKDKIIGTEGGRIDHKVQHQRILGEPGIWAWLRNIRHLSKLTEL